MENERQWHTDITITRTIKALESNLFKAKAFNNRDDLIREVMGFMVPGVSVGFGGSLTVRSLGLVEKAESQGAIVVDHWEPGLSKEEILHKRTTQLTCSLFLTSTNAVTEKGELVNIDGFGNRTNAMTFGPKKVIVVAGYNKIVTDVSQALERIKKVAAPMNARRLGLTLPCAETGYCTDCKSEQRICRVVSILQRKPGATDISVFLINEELGL